MRRTTDSQALAARRALRIILNKDVPLSEVDWKKLAETGRYQGKALSDLPLQYLIQRSISQEAFEFAEDSGGYGSIMRTWNAADGFPFNLADFGRTISYLNLVDGFDSLPRAIEQRFREAGGAVHFGHRLTSFDTATLADGSTGVEMKFTDERGAAQTRRTRRLILAMPRRSLELLDRTGAVLGRENRRVRQLIGSVTPIPLFKLAICYPFAWWETLAPVPVQADGTIQWRKITKGESITDLPVRQVYYWAVDEKTGNAVVLVYDDGLDLDYWAGLRERVPADEAQAAFASAALPGDSPGSPEWNENKAPYLMVEEAHRQLREIHGVQNRVDIPEPYAAAYRDWGEDPYGGGANFWHLHVNSEEVGRAILQPEPGAPVYICGEAYSHFQGWVEGALQTADEMLGLHFGLPSAAWLR